MRRLITYMAVAGGLIVGMALNFMGVVQTTRGNLEFSNGREFVYRLTDKEDEDALIPEGAVSDIAFKMEARLETALVTKYEIETEGANQIRVTLGENTDISYQRIRNYLNFDGEFSICTTTDVCAVGDEMFEGSTARVDYKGQYPHIVIPLSNPTYFIDQIIAEAERISRQYPSEEGELNSEAYILLWANRLEGETYEDSKTKQKVADKIILQFNFNSIWWDEDNKTEITAAVDLSKYGSADDRNIYPASAVSQANETALYFSNLFNAGSLEYDVEFLFEAPVTASIENVLVFGRNIGLAWSNTLLASLVASIIVIGIIAYFYRLLSVAILTSTAASLFTTTLVFNLVGMQFSSATIIGVLSIALLTLLSGLVFAHKFRNELYRGRTLKKAFIESSRKVTWPLIDLSIVTLLFGLLTYILGGNLVRNFSVYVMLGGVANLIFVLLGLKAMFWLLANEPALADKLHLFAVDSKKIPNTLNEEKQSYFGRFAHLTYNKQTTKVGISGGLVAFLGAALTLFLALTSQPLVASPSNTINTRIYFEVTERSDIESTTWLEENVLEYLTIDGKAISYAHVSVHELTRIEQEIEVDYRFFVVTSSSKYDGAAPSVFNDGVNSYTGNLEDVLNQIVYGIDEDETVSMVSIHEVSGVSAQPSIGQLALGILAGIGAMMLYVFARHFAARTLSLLGVTALGTFITLTFFLLTRIPSLNIAGLAMYPVALFIVYVGLVIFSKEKEIIEEGNKEEEKLALRIMASPKAVAQSASILYVIGGVFAYVALNFFGFGPSAMSPLFAGVTIGIGLALVFVLALLGPWNLCLAKTFARWNLESKLPKPTKKTRKKKPVAEAKSAEPQEATFIGIND